MHSLEIPPEPSINFGQLASKAVGISERTKLAEFTADREPVTGLLFCDVDGFSEVGVSLEQTEDDGYNLDLHLLHIDALAPANSPLDNLMRYSYAYDRSDGRKAVASIWRTHFKPSRQSKWPTLSVSVPLKPQEDGSLRIGWPTVGETAFTPSGIVAESNKARLDQEDSELPPKLGLLLDVSRQLAQQRFDRGAFEAMHGGRIWRRDPNGGELLVPMPNADFIKRELLLTGAISVGRWFKSQRIPGLFLGHNRPAKLEAEHVALMVRRYFDGQETAYALWNTIVTARGAPRVEAAPLPNNNAYDGPVVTINSGRARYDELVNARMVEGVGVYDREAYTEREVAAFAVISRSVTQMLRSRRSEIALTTGRVGVLQTKSRANHAQNLERASLSADELATLDNGAFRKMYDFAGQGHIDGPRFVEACSIRARTKGSIPTKIVLESLLSGRKSAVMRRLREPVLLYIANSPSQTDVILNNAKAARVVLTAAVESVDEGVSFTIATADQTVTAVAENETDAKISALILLAPHRQGGVDYYRNHPDAARWTAVEEGLYERSVAASQSPVALLNRLSKLSRREGPTAEYVKLEEVRGEVTVLATATINGVHFRAQASGKDFEAARLRAAERVIAKHERLIEESVE